MTLLSRLFARTPDPRERVRPLWHRVVEIAREPGWYAKGGIADTVAGRFDAITLVLGVVLLRLETRTELAGDAALLTELFVEDMDGQLRESGIGDVVVGKHIGKLMGAMGGRLGALRAAFESGDEAALAGAVERNTTFGDNGDPACVVKELRLIAGQLAALSDAQLLAGEIER